MKHSARGGAFRRFQTEAGRTTREVTVDGGTVTIDGRSVPVAYKRLTDRRIWLLIDGRSYDAIVLDEDEDGTRIQVGRREFYVRLKNERDLLLEKFGLASVAESDVREIRAPMPGLVLSVRVEAGQKVDGGGGLLVLEAMKMENEIRADRSGTVKTVHVQPGDGVGKGDLLIEME
ncbi:MAG: acetyl-CoA carboxylase biotin carboxyl carrier protein subunit [Rhodothermales bacterium]